LLFYLTQGVALGWDMLAFQAAAERKRRGQPLRTERAKGNHGGIAPTAAAK